MTTAVKRCSATAGSGEVSCELRWPVALRFFEMWLPAMRLFAIVPIALAVGCAGERSPSAVRAPEPQRIEVPRTIITPGGATSLPEMFAEAEAKARAGDLEGAA